MEDNGYASSFDIQPGDTQPPEFGMTMGPNAGDIQQYQRPAANPQEYEMRLTSLGRVVDKFMNDPNLQRSLFLVGAQMMQPLQPGQTSAGALGNAAVTGLNAYQQGQQADFARQLALRKEGREERGVGIQESQEARQVGREPLVRGHLQAETDLTGARAREEATKADITIATKDDAIAQARTARERSEFLLKKDYSEEAVGTLERDVRALKAFAARNRDWGAAMQTEIDTAEANLQKTRAQAGLETAQGRLAAGKATEQELENLDLAAMTPEQRQALRTAKHGGQTSAVLQQEGMYRRIYKALPDNDPAKQGQTEDQYVANVLRSGRLQDVTQQFNNYVRAMDAAGQKPDPDVMAAFQEAIKQSAGGRAGKAQGVPNTGGGTTRPDTNQPAPKASTGGLPAPKTLQERDALPSGTRYVDPFGVIRKRP